MKKISSIIISFLVGFIILFAVIRWAGWKEIINSFEVFLSYKGLSLVIITFIIWFLGSLKWKMVLSSKGYDFPLKKIVQMYFAGFALNYLTPVVLLGGEGFRAYALKKYFPISWSKNIAVLLIEKILSIICLIFFLAVGFFSFIFLTSFYQKYNYYLLIASFLLVIFLILFFYLELYKKEKINKLFFNLLGIKNNGLVHGLGKDIYSFFDFKKNLFWQTFFISFLRYIFVFFRIGLLLFFLTGNVNILIVAGIMFFAYIAYMIPIPASIGSLEVAQSFAFTAFNFSAVQGVNFSFILRLAELFVVVFGIVLLIKLGTGIFYKIIKNIFSYERKN